MWISERFHFTDVFWTFLSWFFRLFFTCAYALCARFKRFYCFLFMKGCHVVWWICGVGISFCVFLVSLIFTNAIIVVIIVDLCVWLCQNLMRNIFCLFFLQVVNWVVWHDSNCFQRTSSRRTRFCTIYHHVPFVQCTLNETIPPPLQKKLNVFYYVIEIPTV